MSNEPMSTSRPDSRPSSPDAAQPSSTDSDTAVIARTNWADVLYGAVLTASVIAVVSSHPESTARLELAVVFALFVYWMAHVYCRVLAARLGMHRTPLGRQLRSALTRESAILIGGLPGVAVPLVCRLFGIDISVAADLTLWTIVILLFGVGLAAGSRSGARPVVVLLQASASAALGLLVVLLKVALH